MIQHPHQVAFDANNIEHRKAYQYFLKNSKWESKAPRFELEEPYLAIPFMIQHKLIDYYMTKEKL
jgi:hypothetical protein